MTVVTRGPATSRGVLEPRTLLVTSPCSPWVLQRPSLCFSVSPIWAAALQPVVSGLFWALCQLARPHSTLRFFQPQGHAVIVSPRAGLTHLSPLGTIPAFAADLSWVRVSQGPEPGFGLGRWSVLA